MDPDNSYREEAPVSMASRSVDDENDSKPPGRSSSESAFLKTKGRCLKIGTWNVRTLSSSLCAICSQQVGCRGSPSFSILCHSDTVII